MTLERSKAIKGQAMQAIARMIGMASLAGLAACGGDAQLMNLQSSQNSPDEFSVLPTKPLSMPADLAVLPAPTPGGANITDPTPFADAVGAMGGNPAALADNGIAAQDQALVAYASRAGNDPQVRQNLAEADARWRGRNGPRPLERLANTNVYNRAYKAVALDPYAEQLRWQRAGARTPSAPPTPEE